MEGENYYSIEWDIGDEVYRGLKTDSEEIVKRLFRQEPQDEANRIAILVTRSRVVVRGRKQGYGFDAGEEKEIFEGLKGMFDEKGKEELIEELESKMNRLRAADKQELWREIGGQVEEVVGDPEEVVGEVVNEVFEGFELRRTNWLVAAYLHDDLTELRKVGYVFEGNDSLSLEQIVDNLSMLFVRGEECEVLDDVLAFGMSLDVDDRQELWKEIENRLGVLLDHPEANKYRLKLIKRMLDEYFGLDRDRYSESGMRDVVGIIDERADVLSRGRIRTRGKEVGMASELTGNLWEALSSLRTEEGSEARLRDQEYIDDLWVLIGSLSEDVREDVVGQIKNRAVAFVREKPGAFAAGAYTQYGESSGESVRVSRRERGNGGRVGVDGSEEGRGSLVDQIAGKERKRGNTFENFLEFAQDGDYHRKELVYQWSVEKVRTKPKKFMAWFRRWAMMELQRELDDSREKMFGGMQQVRVMLPNEIMETSMDRIINSFPKEPAWEDFAKEMRGLARMFTAIHNRHRVYMSPNHHSDIDGLSDAVASLSTGQVGGEPFAIEADMWVNLSRSGVLDPERLAGPTVGELVRRALVVYLYMAPKHNGGCLMKEDLLRLGFSDEKITESLPDESYRQGVVIDASGKKSTKTVAIKNIFPDAIQGYSKEEVEVNRKTIAKLLGGNGLGELAEDIAFKLFESGLGGAYLDVQCKTYDAGAKVIYTDAWREKYFGQDKDMGNSLTLGVFSALATTYFDAFKFGKSGEDKRTLREWLLDPGLSVWEIPFEEMPQQLDVNYYGGVFKDAAVMFKYVVGGVGAVAKVDIDWARPIAGYKGDVEEVINRQYVKPIQDFHKHIDYWIGSVGTDFLLWAIDPQDTNPHFSAVKREYREGSIDSKVFAKKMGETILVQFIMYELSQHGVYHNPRATITGAVASMLPSRSPGIERLDRKDLRNIREILVNYVSRGRPDGVFTNDVVTTMFRDAGLTTGQAAARHVVDATNVMIEVARTRKAKPAQQRRF